MLGEGQESDPANDQRRCQTARSTTGTANSLERVFCAGPSRSTEGSREPQTSGSRANAHSTASWPRADPNAVYRANEQFWQEATGKLAIYLESRKAIPSRTELFIDVSPGDRHRAHGQRQES